MVDQEILLPSGGRITKKDILLKYANGPVFETPLPPNPNFQQLSQRLQEINAIHNEIDPFVNHAEMTFKGPVLINWVADIHAGHASSRLDRVDQEVQTILATPNSYVFGGGDWIDAMNWNPGQMEQAVQVPLQVRYMRSLIRELGDRLLVSWVGDHDGWLGKMGASAFEDFGQLTGSYIMGGVGTVKLNVGNVTYNGVAGHRFPGNSMYNNLHPIDRMARFGMQGADFYMCGHTHKSGVGISPIEDIEGSRKVAKLVSGPYKPQDSWLRKMGYVDQEPDAMFGSAIMLDPTKKVMRVYDDILLANEDFSRLYLEP